MIYPLTKRHRVEIEQSFFHERVMNYVGAVSHCRSVSKAFVPIDYITKLTFLKQSWQTDITTILSDRPNVVEVHFEECNTLNANHYEKIAVDFPQLQKMVIIRSSSLEKYPMFKLFDQFREIKPIKVHLSLSTHSMEMSFVGCWRLFTYPTPMLSAEDSLEIILGAIKWKTWFARQVAEAFSCGWYFFEFDNLKKYGPQMTWRILCTESSLKKMIFYVFINESQVFRFRFAFFQHDRYAYECWFLVSLSELKVHPKLIENTKKDKNRYDN